MEIARDGGGFSLEVAFVGNRRGWGFSLEVAFARDRRGGGFSQEVTRGRRAFSHLAEGRRGEGFSPEVTGEGGFLQEVECRVRGDSQVGDCGGVAKPKSQMGKG